jgi:hypothetical protein
VVITRKLQEIGQILGSITNQNDLTQFLNNMENAQRLDSLVGDIRDALMGYQVCTPKPLLLITSNNATDLSTASYP